VNDPGVGACLQPPRALRGRSRLGSRCLCESSEVQASSQRERVRSALPPDGRARFRCFKTADMIAGKITEPLARL
jgi:hypothetical protein